MKAETCSPFVVFIAIIFNDAYCENPQKVLRKISAAFGVTVWECKKEVTFSLDIVKEFLHYWERSYVFRNPELGCVVICILVKLQLVDQNNRVLEKNALEFAKVNYADEKIAHQLLNYWLTCHRSNETNATLTMNTEPCAVGLALARCFRRAVLHHHQEPQLSNTYDDEYGYD